MIIIRVQARLDFLTCCALSSEEIEFPPIPNGAGKFPNWSWVVAAAIKRSWSMDEKVDDPTAPPGGGVESPPPVTKRVSKVCCCCCFDPDCSSGVSCYLRGGHYHILSFFISRQTLSFYIRYRPGKKFQGIPSKKTSHKSDILKNKRRLW